jgi:hypothetical protein
MALADRITEAGGANTFNGEAETGGPLAGWTRGDAFSWYRGHETMRLAEAGTPEGWQWIYTPNTPTSASYPPLESWAFLKLAAALEFANS